MGISTSCAAEIRQAKAKESAFKQAFAQQRMQSEVQSTAPIRHWSIRSAGGAYAITVLLPILLSHASKDQMHDALRQIQDAGMAGGWDLKDGETTALTFYREAETDCPFIADNYPDLAQADTAAAAIKQLCAEFTGKVPTAPPLVLAHLQHVAASLRGEGETKTTIENLRTLQEKVADYFAWQRETAAAAL